MGEPSCRYCRVGAELVLAQDALVRMLGDAVHDAGCIEVAPLRHVATWLETSEAERAAIRRAVDAGIERLRLQCGATRFRVGWDDSAEEQRSAHLRVQIRARDGSATEPLLVTGEADPFLSHLRVLFPRARRVDIAVAFVLNVGVERIRPDLVELLARGATLRVVTGDYRDVTDPPALRRLLDLDGGHEGEVDLRVFETRGGPSFHPKAYLFDLGDGDGVAFVGSSNISSTALGEGVEWNYRVVGASDRAGFRAVAVAFENVLRHPRTRALTREWIDAYEKRRGVVSDASPRAPVEPEPLPEPATARPIQQAALAALAQTRSAGHRRGLVVLATGLGKTWLAAFDSAAFERVLFVAHRQEILDQALTVFRRVQPGRRLGSFTGRHKDHQADVVFASVQALSRDEHLWSFARDRFAYVVVDEFHHADAATYRRLLDHFEPEFLLGLTATPERSDGGDLLALCGGNLVFRCDLAEGIRLGWLSPLRYFGVPDDVDYAQIPWRSGRFDDEQLTLALATGLRATNALEQLDRHGAGRTLAFCCSVRHADFMAQFLREHGRRAVAVHSKPTSASRERSLEQLEAGELDVVCCVDMFNEGVDLPRLDTVLLLRPTESRVLWLQQIGRGLRRHADKAHLTIVDYIGNHRAFLDKPRALLGVLLGIADDLESLRGALARVRDGTAALPPGCSVTYELEVLEILDRLLAPRPAEQVLREFYRDHRSRHGVRPSAVEAFRAGVLSRKALGAAGSWFGMVAEEGDLDALAQRVLGTQRALLDHVERTKVASCLDVLVLIAVLDERQAPGALSIAGLVDRVARLVPRYEFARRDLGAHLDDPDALRALLVAQSIPVWTTRGARHGARFDQDGERFSLDVAAVPEEHEALVAMLRELAEWRLEARAAELLGQSLGFRVTTRGSERILEASGDAPSLPDGRWDLWADGERYVGRSTAGEIRDVRAPSGANALPGILRSWFGASADGASVVAEPYSIGFRLQPEPLRRRILDDDGRELDATFLVESTTTLVFESRGGTRGSKSQRNADYDRGLELALARLGRAGVSLSAVQLATSETKSLQPQDLRLAIRGHELPIDLSAVTDFVALRKAIGAAQAAAGRKPGAKGGGNRTKRIRLLLATPRELERDRLGEIVRSPSVTRDE